MSLSKTLPGDQLVIEVAEESVQEAEDEVETHPVSRGNFPQTEGAELAPETLEEELPALISGSDDLFRRRQNAVEWQDDDPEDEEEADESEASGQEVPNARFVSDQEASEAQPEETPIAAVPASVPKVKAALAKYSDGNGLSAKTRTSSQRGMPDSATQRSGNREKPEGAPPNKATPLNSPLISVNKREAEKHVEATFVPISSVPELSSERIPRQK